MKAKAGVLAIPTPATRKGIADDVVSLVHGFCQDDEFTRLLPGSKDVVSVGYKIHQQKRLLLCNLKELFIGVFYSVHLAVMQFVFAKFTKMLNWWLLLVNCITKK